MNKESMYLLGIDIGGSKVSISIGDFSGVIMDRTRFPTPSTYDEFLELSFALVARYIHRQPVKAIGISCAGPLDTKKGRILSPANLPSFNGVPIVNDFIVQFHLPVFLENDANASALAEWKWGNGRGKKNIIFLTFGTGLAAGLILDGKLYRGSTGFAGEVGHVRLSKKGPSCHRKTGSFESFCSGNGLSCLFEFNHGVRYTAKEICEKAAQGDEKALAVIDKSATYLGQGIAMLCDILNPECIIIGSIYSQAEDLFKTKMKEVLHKEALSETIEALEIFPCWLKDDLGDMAALGVALNGLKVNE